MVLLKSESFVAAMPCPPFRLEAVDGSVWDSKELKGAKALLVAFICNHCPYVRAIEERLIRLAAHFLPQGLVTVGICANDAERYPDDAKDVLFKRWQEKQYGFPYLIDEDQSVAKAFGAVCTPDLFLFDGHGLLFYRGQLDDNWHDEQEVRHHDLAEAVKLVLSGKEPPYPQQPSMGCSIKWRE